MDRPIYGGILSPKDTPVKDPDVYVQLATAWLGEFQGLARAQDADEFKKLFHPKAVLWGVEKGGCCDWPLRLQFTFSLRNALISPVPPFVLVLCDWLMEPLVHGGEQRKGHGTFLLDVTPPDGNRKGKVACVHAHFSALVKC